MDSLLLMMGRHGTVAAIAAGLAASAAGSAPPSAGAAPPAAAGDSLESMLNAVNVCELVLRPTCVVADALLLFPSAPQKKSKNR